MNEKKLYEYNIKGLELKEFLELKNKDELWKVVEDDIFKTIYKNSGKGMSKINDFVLLIEQTGVIKTNIQDIFKEESGQYISHKFSLSKLLYNMGRDFFDKIEKEQNNWMYAVLSFESAILIDKYDVSSYYLLLLCNIKAGEKEELEKNYKRFNKNIEDLKEKDYRLYNEQEELIKKYKETYNNFIEENSNKKNNTLVDNSSKEVNSVVDNSIINKEQGKSEKVVEEKTKTNKGSNINKILIVLVLIALITSIYSVVKVVEYQDKITYLEENNKYLTDKSDQYFSDISLLKKDSALVDVDLTEYNYSIIRSTESLTFYLMLEDIKKVGSSAKITYWIGNPYNATFPGFDITLNPINYDDFNTIGVYEKEKNYTSAIETGWNEYTITLPNFDFENYNRIYFKNFKTESILLEN